MDFKVLNELEFFGFFHLSEDLRAGFVAKLSLNKGRSWSFVPENLPAVSKAQYKPSIEYV